MTEERFKKPSVAASVAVFRPLDSAFLVIVRKHGPFEGMLAFPGGYLDVDREDVESAAIRELFEETGFVADRAGLSLLDVRSKPDRDPRGHVIDVGFLWIASEAIREPPEATEEADPKWVPWAMLETAEFAFDHKEMFDEACVRLGLIGRADGSAL